MAIIKNHFETTLSDDIALTTHTITGLTAADSSTSVNYFCQQASLYFLKSIYKTLIDAGYSDAAKNEVEFSITVLGFKFFVLVPSYYDIQKLTLFPSVHVHGLSNKLNTFSNSSSANSGRIYTLNDISTYAKTLSYNIIIRGDEKCVQIAYSSYDYPNSEVPLIFIANAKNLITSEDSFLYGSEFTDNSTDHVYFRDKNNLYNNIHQSINNNSYNGYFSTYYTYTGLNTQSKFVCEPILGNYGTYLIYSLLKCNDVYFERGKYYKIGDDLYFCYGYKEGSATSYNGSYLLFKVS